MSPLPIAAGENHYGKWEFKELIERGALAFVQADVVKCGGVSEFLKIAAMADAHGLPMCPHFSNFVDVACVAAVPNGLFHEYAPDFFEPASLLIETAPGRKPGRLRRSTGLASASSYVRMQRSDAGARRRAGQGGGRPSAAGAGLPTYS